MMKKFSLCLVGLFSLCILNSAMAADKSYVVYLRRDLLGSSTEELGGDEMSHTYHHLLASCMESKEKAREAIFYSYSGIINGFAATLEDDELEQLERHPQVLQVLPNEAYQIQTTRSWAFMGLEDSKGVVPPNSLWKKTDYGKDRIIATLDTGVWPESPFFNDKGYGPIPSRWNGTCDTAGGSFKCNKKLIGARAFNNGQPGSSPRDVNGHGTHTLSTAGGAFVPKANFLGSANGTAKGGSPKARVAAYKVCNDNGNCFTADITAGFDAAIHDKVDVISVSLGSFIPGDYSRDGIAIGAFHAVRKGITVVCSAGNSGFDGSVTNVAPWIITVAASTLDRRFLSDAVIGNGKRYKGISFKSNTLPSKKFYPLVNSVSVKAPGASNQSALYCYPGSLDPAKVKGKIVLCRRSGVDVQKSYVVSQAGGVGVILANTFTAALAPQAHFIPTSTISQQDGDAIARYISNTSKPVAYLIGYTEIGKVEAPVMAGFSSRGPNRLTPEILKPDITAPGVYIMAGWTQANGPTGQSYDSRRLPFNVISGTSMSCPHVSGIAGLLKTLHPKWSPAAIKSAIITTAKATNNKGKPINTEAGAKAIPFNYGAGHVAPNPAASPGLVYEMNTTDYVNFLCYIGYTKQQIAVFYPEPYQCPPKTSTSLSNLNYPSISVPNLSGKVNVTRTVKNVGTPGVYRVRVGAPAGITVGVSPRVLRFSRVNQSKKYTVSLEAMNNVGTGYLFGNITWSDGKHVVRSPLVVRKTGNAVDSM
ncbi:unnamed protein product [Linum trigynum]|uniref:Subtilisin-like protease SBT5.3 n=2 Tax=Linum trigynum TaxID=586398 RepID=A0AAV2C6W4_9ROSI